MTELNYITLEDTYAAMFLALAEAHLLLDEAAERELTARLKELGYHDPMAFALTIVAAARGVTRGARAR